MARSSKYLRLFERFIKDIRIASKEIISDDPRGAPLVMWESQRRFMLGLGEALDEGKHTLNCLKSRQLGITTISIALVDVFWIAMHPNIIGCMVADTEKNRNANRILIEQYVASFPDGYFGDEFRVVRSNRDFIQFSNGARLDLLVAGVKKKPIAWGQGQGYALCHATEVGNYADEEGLQSLEEGFAQQNPNRLFVFESTAKGFNHWRSRWMAGLDSDTQKSIFIGWWAGDTNVISRKDRRYARFASFDSSKEERELIAAVEREYGHKITDEQMAWFRWKQDNARTEQDLLQQNQPFTAAQAFVMSGYSFFATRKLTADMQKLVTGEIDGVYQGYKYNCDADFFSFSMSRLDPETDRQEDIDLKVWEEPVPDGRYVIGLDPAYGRNAHKDNHCLMVFRCYADKMVQVAEYVESDVETRHAAWVLFHLCSAYGNCMANVELTGPGRLVMTEFNHLREMIGADVYQQRVKDREWSDAAAHARWFLYKKVDSPGPGYVYNFESSWRTKQEMLYGFRGCWMGDEMIIRSAHLIREMQNVVVEGDSIGAPESTNEDMKDDRVFAAALAYRAWSDWVRREMLSQGLTYDVVMQNESADQNDPKVRVSRRMNDLVYRFLAPANEEIEVDTRPRWQVERGLA